MIITIKCFLDYEHPNLFSIHNRVFRWHATLGGEEEKREGEVGVGSEEQKKMRELSIWH